MSLVLAFDIERSGGHQQHHTIAIGAVLMDENFEVLKRFLYKCYVESAVNFEDRCKVEFWDHFPEILEDLKVESKVPFEDLQKEMISQFHDFRKECERYAEEKSCKLQLTTDNKCYDVYFINYLMSQYLDSSILPMPYCASVPQKYKQVMETGMQVVGMTMNGKENISVLYNIPPWDTDIRAHMPDEDAVLIARHQQILNGIYSGKYSKK
jgi:hypothetical protein